MAKIVLVEDNSGISKAYSTALEMDGHEVRVAHDETTLSQLMVEELPELLLLDVGLPGVDGLEILRRLREEPDTSKLKIAVLSNYTDRNIVHRALKLEVMEYVEKASTTPRLLVEQVRRWLD